MNDCINISARVDDKLDMLCPWEKLCGRRPTSLVLPFMMPGFRHTNRKTKMHSKGESCFCLNTGHDHSSTAHKVLFASGVASHTADVTFGYHRRPFVGSPQRGKAGLWCPYLLCPLAAVDGSRERCRSGRASAGAAAGATTTAAFNGS